MTDAGWTLDGLALARSGSVMTITLDRPEIGNAVDRTMHRSLEQAFSYAAQDAETRVVVITGSGEQFSVGGNLDAMLNDALTGIGNPERSTILDAPTLFRSILRVPQPIISAVNGDAVGLGATMALLGDIVVMADSARIGDPHVRVGLTAGDGGAVIWPLLAGTLRSKRYLLTGSLMSATEAERFGLVSDVVPQGEVLSTAYRLAQRISAYPTEAVRWTKELINDVIHFHAERKLDRGAEYEAQSARLPSHEAAVRDALRRTGGVQSKSET